MQRKSVGGIRCALGACGAAILAAAMIAAGAEPKTSATRGPATAPATAPAHPFRKNVKVEVADTFFIVKSDGLPDHTTGDFPNRFNPNKILEQQYTFKIPRKPVKADKVTKLPMGPIGVAVNGVPFYNPYTAEGLDASKNEVFDECCGHPDPLGRYHYHIYPKCIKTPFKKDAAGKHSDLLGYAFDGYAIYGPLGEGGKAPTDLDECNGHEDKERGYHYHVTDKFPYIIGGYRGEVELLNMDRGGRDPRGRGVGPIRGRGGPGGAGGPMAPPGPR